MVLVKQTFPINIVINVLWSLQIGSNKIYQNGDKKRFVFVKCFEL